MKKKILPALMVACGVLSLFPAGRAGEITDAERREAIKVIRFLNGIEAGSLSKKPSPLRRMDFTESELNSYIAYRIETEKEEIMKELRLKVFAQNRIEGKVFIDLSGQKLPFFLKPKMNLYFEGVFITQGGQIRLDFQKLFLDGQPVPLMLLDMVIYAASKLNKTASGSINDWYALPSGIGDLRTASGRVSVFY